ncbi:uncharacterized protein LOC124286189 [Haliotis rubra]|uniref:uncharacterized protein LOC124286189 n=1 Tax=Haliotis rubra TaxID=36100 RepID=UPI001EE59E6E|nr:uncharacterized protein LOC124286189 [Haliotis rubra]
MYAAPSALLVLAVSLLVCVIRRCRRRRELRKLRYAAYLTVLNNRVSFVSSESPYARVHDEGVSLSHSGMRHATYLQGVANRESATTERHYDTTERHFDTTEHHYYTAVCNYDTNGRHYAAINDEDVL